MKNNLRTKKNMANYIIEDICETHCSNSHFNISLCSERDYVDCHMEVRLLAVAYLVPITVIMVLILLSGMIGNICVCVVIVRHPTMKTVTNYYLFSLAVSDLLLLLFGLPQELWYYWQIHPDLFGSSVCKLRAFISETTTYASVLTVVFFSIERYIAICHPFHSCSLSGYKRAVTAIVIIWTLSMACAVPLTLGNVVEPLVEYPPNSSVLSNVSKVCWLSNEAELHNYLAAISVIFFFIPMTVLAFTYTKIGFCIRSRTIAAANNLQGRVNTDRGDQDKTALKVLAAVVITFFVCWAPFHVQRLINSDTSEELKGPLFILTGFLYYLSACVNPILYNVMSKRYRKAFKETFFSADPTSQESCRKTNNRPLREYSKTSSTKSTDKS